MKLSKNFTLAEIEHSSTAKRLGISNEMPKKHIDNMQRLITDLVQPMRNDLGPIRITSGYRSKALNSAIGGSNRSQHSKGQALDLQFWKRGEMNNEKIYKWILESGLQFDQMINEFDFAWIHLSLKEAGNRKDVLEAYKDKEGYTAYRYA